MAREKRLPDCIYYQECLDKHALINLSFSCRKCVRYEKDKGYILRDIHGSYKQNNNNSDMNLRRLTDSK